VRDGHESLHPRRQVGWLGHAQQGYFRARAAHRSHSALYRLAARQAPRRHACGEEPCGYLAHRQEDKCAEGTGGARHGSARANLFRGGGRSFGPHPRDHAIDLPKKVRALALRHALSAKAKDGGIIVLDDIAAKDAKTKALTAQFEKLGLANALIVGGAQIEENFGRAARNIPNIDVLPVQGINVYDILRRQQLVLTKAAVEALEARFK
jgi:large subunit ribosomal protein L4